MPAVARADVLWYQQCANGNASMLGAYAQSGISQGTACPTANGGDP